MLTGIRQVDRAQTLTEKVYDQIRDALVAGDFSVGQDITLRSLAKSLGTSPTPVRDAISRLVAERALELNSNRSVYVPRMTVERCAELTEIRCALEALAAEAAARAISGADLQSLRRAYDDVTTPFGATSLRRRLMQNEEFYFSVYRLSRLNALCALIRTVWMQVGPSLSLLYEKELAADHLHKKALLEALGDGDEGAARSALEQDIRSTMQRLMTVVAGQEDRSVQERLAS